ncbi:MAG: stalk domain-containing protein, partial [Mesobacillus sp.]|uniref:stalk domain-containing protein n=1 Tax=Mesobacillus sp. TaxID=2675271 RepID=UPI003C463E7D
MAELKIKEKKYISKKIILAGLIFSAFIIASSIYYLLYPFASTEKTDYFQGESPIVYKGEQAGNALIHEDTVYVPLDFLKKIDESIVFDAESNSVIFTTADKVVQMPTDSLTYFINEKPVKLQMTPILSDNGKLYVALDPVIGYYPHKYKILKETKAILVQTDGEKIRAGKVTGEDVHQEELLLRSGAGLD